MDSLVGRAFCGPGPFPAKDLGVVRPVEIANQIGRGDQMAGVGGASVTKIDRRGLAPIGQGNRGIRRLEEEADVSEEGGLIRLDQDQIVAAGLPDLLADVALTEKGIAGQNAIVPVD